MINVLGLALSDSFDSGADLERGGHRGHTPTRFPPKFFKSPLNWPKKSWEQAPEATAPPPFSNHGSAPLCLVIWVYGHYKNFLPLQCSDRLQSSESHVYRRQLLTTKVDPRTVRVK